MSTAPHPSRTRLGPVLLALLLASAAGPTMAQEADALFRDLVPFGGLEVGSGGETLSDAEIFLAEKAGAYLILAPQLGDPLLVNVRAKQVQKVATDKLRKKDDGTLDILADATFEAVGPFQISGSQLSFTADEGRKITLGPKPDLIGPQPASALLGHNAAYAFGAERYPPNEGNIAALAAEEREVKVRVYFGSWCSTCSRVLPWILKVERQLEGSKIQFEYYGLSRTMDSPVAAEAKITSVPTAVVSIGDQEIGRSTVPDLGVPEKAIHDLLAKAPSP